MLDPDLQLLIDAAHASGDIARKHWGNGPEAWDKDGGQGPVSEADLEIDQMLGATLRAARPDYGWLSEETGDEPSRLDRARTFVIDPIDGTRAFLAGEKTFSHALAIVENGIPIAGVVYLPLKDRLYAARLGHGATKNGDPIRHTARSALEGATLTGAKPNFKPEHWGGDLPVQRTFRSSLAYRLAMVADAQVDGMLTLRPSWEWDIAAGALIATEAGATVTDQNGGALRFNNPHPQVNGVITATPNVHDALMARRTPPIVPSE